MSSMPIRRIPDIGRKGGQFFNIDRQAVETGCESVDIYPDDSGASGINTDL